MPSCVECYRFECLLEPFGDPAKGFYSLGHGVGDKQYIYRQYNKHNRMQENNDKPTVRPNPKCTDTLYLLLTSALFVSILIYSCICLNVGQLRDLSMPRNAEGKPCHSGSANDGYSYLRINGPMVADRECVVSCDGDVEVGDQLGGLCVSPRVHYILNQNGQYQKYIQPKLNTLARFKIVAIAVGACLATSLLIMVLGEVFAIAGCRNAYSIILVVLSIVAGGAGLYFLFGKLLFPIWVTLCMVFALYLLYILVWRVLRSNHSTTIPPSSAHTTISTIMTRLFCILMTVSLSVGFACLVLFQYLAFASHSPLYTWTKPALFAEVAGLTWREIAVLVEALYLISFTTVLNEYLLGSVHANSLGIANTLYSLFRCFLGSVCKLAIIRVLLFIPIFILTLLKPLQSQKCSNACHCLCGYVLNLARKYSLPILSYQSAIKQTLSLGEAADRLHYEAHINGIEYSQGYIDRKAGLAILASVATAAVLIMEARLGLEVSLLTYVLGLVLGLWMGSLLASAWIHTKEGQEVRRICEHNRQESVV